MAEKELERQQLFDNYFTKLLSLMNKAFTLNKNDSTTNKYLDIYNNTAINEHYRWFELAFFEVKRAIKNNNPKWIENLVVQYGKGVPTAEKANVVLNIGFVYNICKDIEKIYTSQPYTPILPPNDIKKMIFARTTPSARVCDYTLQLFRCSVNAKKDRKLLDRLLVSDVSTAPPPIPQEMFDGIFSSMKTLIPAVVGQGNPEAEKIVEKITDNPKLPQMMKGLFDRIGTNPDVLKDPSKMGDFAHELRGTMNTITEEVKSEERDSTKVD